MKNKVLIIAAFPAMGKTYFTEHNSKYYVEEMTDSTEDDGKIYADPALISDLMFY